MPGTPLDFPTLRLIGWPYPGPPEDRAWADLFSAHPKAKPARVSEQHRSGYVVADGPESGLKAESLPEWQKPRFPSHERAAVGDWVLLEGKKIVALLPRHTSIKRGAAGERLRPHRVGACTCAGHQRELAVALKRARHVALLPYAPQHLRP